MSPDEETSLSDAESVDKKSDTTAETEPEASAPLNRAERRAQAQGKKSTTSGNAFVHPQPTNLRGMMNRGGKSKTMFSRKSGSK